MRTNSMMIIVLAVVSSVMIFLPVRGIITCTLPKPMCGGGGGGTGSPSFALSMNPANLQVYVGGFSVSSTISVTSVNCFVGSVSLNASASPVTNAPTEQATPTSVSLACNGSATSTLTVSTTLSTATGSYTIEVVGVSGALAAQAFVSLSIPFPSDPFYSNQWGPSDLNLPNAWAKTLGTHNRIIAVVDSGIWFDHPDLQGNLWTAADGSHGVNFVGATDYSACIPTSTNAADDYGHGTAVAGVVAAVINNGVGVAGTAQERIMSVKALDNRGFFQDVWVGCGIKWAVDHGANVINLSLGCSCTESQYPDMTDAVHYAWGKGALIVGSAGNEGSNIVDCPACGNDVIAVSALVQGDTGLDPISNYGSKIELSAPGNHIYTTFWTDAAYSNVWDPSCFVQQLAQPYCYDNHTSFAAPFVAGIAALAWDYNIQQGTNTLTNQEIKDAVDAYVVTLSCSNCKPKPDALLLLNNMASTHTYMLYAHWQYFLSSGTEGKSQVYVYDSNVNPANAVISNWQNVGNGLTLNVMTGHSLDVLYLGCFNDGSNNVQVNHVQSSGGPPSGAVQLAVPFTWTMGAVPASTDAIYYIVYSC